MNRIAKIYVETDFDYWKNSVAVSLGIWDPILSFLNSMDFRRFFHGEEKVMDPFPSPRAWTNLSNKIGILSKNGILKFDKTTESRLLELATYASHVGLEAASEFQLFYDIYTSFDMNKIFSGKYEIPIDAAERYAFVCAITSEFYHRYKQNVNDNQNQRKEKYTKVFTKILNDLDEKYPEMNMVIVRYMATRDVAMIKSLTDKNIIDSKLLHKLMNTSQVLR